MVASVIPLVDCVWNVMARAQKPDFVFRRNGRVHLNRQWRQFSRLLAAEVCASAFMVGSNAGYTMFQAIVKGTFYPLHSPVSPSLPLPCVTVCHHVSTGICYLSFCRHVTAPVRPNVFRRVLILISWKQGNFNFTFFLSYLSSSKLLWKEGVPEMCKLEQHTVLQQQQQVTM